MAQARRINPASVVAIREALGMSQAELGRQSGVSQGHISGIEAGEKNASPATIKRLAEAMGVTAAAISTSAEPAEVS
jgi:transcriptional regulator with XRE-family HTH domain